MNQEDSNQEDESQDSNQQDTGLPQEAPEPFDVGLKPDDADDRPDGPFIGSKGPQFPPGADQQEIDRIEAAYRGNKKLEQQISIIKHKMGVMAGIPIQFNPVEINQLRLNWIIDWLLPPEVDENNDYGNPERIAFEKGWNELFMELQDSAIKQGNMQKLAAGVVNDKPVMLTREAIERMKHRDGN